MQPMPPLKKGRASNSKDNDKRGGDFGEIHPRQNSAQKI